MIKLSSVKILVFLFFLFVLSILPLCFSSFKAIPSQNIHNELFSPELINLNSISKITRYIDSSYYATSKLKKIDTALYVKISSDLIKRRFYHGLSHYSIYDNWIAALAGKLFWSHLSAIVKPDDILKHGEGLCSQQTIVFLEILKTKGINFRTIGLGYKEGPGHFLSEVSYNGSWHLHDVSVEPNWKKIDNHHKSANYYMSNKDSLFLAYEGRLERKLFYKIMEKVEYGNINEIPAKRMLMFHELTLKLTYLIPLILLILIIKGFLTINNISSKKEASNLTKKCPEVTEV